MTIRVLNPGLQTTIQAAPRLAMRHLGVPRSGAADYLSQALANRLLGNDLFAPVLEATLVGPQLLVESDTAFAITGADATATLNGEPIEFHCTLRARAGDELRIGSISRGHRTYIAFAGGLVGEACFGSVSTYLPAGFGGFRGRALAIGDVLHIAGERGACDTLQTPGAFRPRIGNRWALRVCVAGETELLSNRQQLFDTQWRVGLRADRMGLALDGTSLAVQSSGHLPSAAVFPGTIQCPESGMPFLLSVDAQTTGGYPRVGQVARVDRHLLGQLRPGDHVLLLPRKPEEAAKELRALHTLWRDWLPGIEQII